MGYCLSCGRLSDTSNGGICQQCWSDTDLKATKDRQRVKHGREELTRTYHETPYKDSKGIWHSH